MRSNELSKLFSLTRTRTENLCAPLETEDYVVQPIIDVSPPKWHLAHTTWFFEEFVLKKYVPEYRIFDERYAYVFNSYYESAGEKVFRSDRGNLSRPTVQEVYMYRKHVTEAILNQLQKEALPEEVKDVILLGCHHEKQHQELLLTDIKYILGNNPLHPAYNNDFEEDPEQDPEQEWISLEEGVYEIGHNKPEEFCFDNELGRHKVYVQNFQISNSLVTNAEFLEFMQAGGYDNFLLWHAEARDWLKNGKVEAPLYWHKKDEELQNYTLSGLKPLNPKAPVTHISYFEAFAFAQWKGMRLPTEFEWEIAQEKFCWGKRWEWTESAYAPYPGYTKAPGTLGEYNGKFMVNQKVLRGGSIATPADHTRPTYRNFFHPHLRWQYTGIRLCK